MARPRSVLCLVLLSSLVLGVSGCEDTWLTAPSGSAITLFSSSDSIPANGSADITATVIEGGQSSDNAQAIVSGVGTPVHNGTVVSFTTNLGTVDPVDAKTTSGGRAVVRFTSDGRTGTATIRAVSGPASQTITITVGSATAR